MKKFIFVILIIFIPVSVHAFDWKDNKVYSLYPTEKWDKTEKIMFGTFATLNIIDCLQTRYIFDHPEKFHEINPIINHIGKKGVIPYFAVCTIGSYFIADHLKPKPRKIFLGFLNVVEIGFTAHNHHIGIRFDF